MKPTIRNLSIIIVIGGACVFPVSYWGFNRLIAKITGHSVTVTQVITRIEPRVAPVWIEHFANAGAAYPPDKLSLLAFKHEAELEVWAPGSDGAWRHVHTWPVLGQSGGPGPKLREGDLQVPEGVYTIAVLNPMSRFHLSLGLNYPNAFDRARAKDEGRTQPGSDIYIHGGHASIGCLALGDPAIEELFYLIATSGKEKASVVIAPNDARRGGDMIQPPNPPPWLPELHGQIRKAWFVDRARLP